MRQPSGASNHKRNCHEWSMLRKKNLGMRSIICRARGLATKCLIMSEVTGKNNEAYVVREESSSSMTRDQGNQGRISPF